MTTTNPTGGRSGGRHFSSRPVYDDEEEEETKHKETLDWKNAKSVATKLFQWLHRGDYSPLFENNAASNIDLTSVNRDEVHRLFEAFLNQQPQQVATATLSNKQKKQHRRLEGLVVAWLKRQKLLKMKRYNDAVVVCSFARLDKTFAPLKERRTARDKLIQQRQELQGDKGGIHVEKEPTVDPSVAVLPINHEVTLEFPIRTSAEAHLPIQLIDVAVAGSAKKRFQVQTRTPSFDVEALKISFRSPGSGVCRASFLMTFQNNQQEYFSIQRSVLLRSGDADMYDILKPKTPFVKKKRTFDKPVPPEKILEPPPQAGKSVKYRDLKQFKPSVAVRELVENREMEGTLAPPSYDTPQTEFMTAYSTFWQNLIWATELQAYEDIKLFDMENARLERKGRFLKLYVAGLAEGRPSVLRGDMVRCTWRGKLYQGRVYAVESLDVLMEFHASFHKKFDVGTDAVDVVRFTFSRTAFRTAHAGVLRAPRVMGQHMLFPQTSHMETIRKQQHQRIQRVLPQRFAWASQTLNEEQKSAISQIAKGVMRPMPFVIFGPPGTGKTTTLVETVYQLARLHTYGPNQKKLKILLVAPSNDATDILVEKLAPYFPPSEMMRVLAYSRSIDQVPSAIRPYVREGLEQGVQIMSKSVQVVVSTVNLAARFWCSGSVVHKGHFDVLCVDEAGHATEPEVIAVATTLMNFSGENPGQVVLAGDPMQLGPVITSDLCKRFGMSVSYMERLVKTSPAYGAVGSADKNKKQNDSMRSYPPELITFLVRNYRSHPAIIKLPNEMFYHNKLVPCGDKLTTHSMIKWEHLPSTMTNSKKGEGFPVVFHAVDGENVREGSSPSWYNPQEAMEVVNYVSLLVKHSRPAIRQDEIGIITPYARQVQKIRTALASQNMGDIKVGSVETFQGQERRCIIISTVRSESEHLAHDLKYNLGFVANEKRFNVAVTRAKALLVIIGNPRVLATDKKNWLPMLQYCRDHGSWMGQDWDEHAQDDDDVADEAILFTPETRTTPVVAPSPHPSDDEWEVLNLPAADDNRTNVVEQEAFGFINREE